MDQFGHFNQNINTSNRVYLNRNFNRTGADGATIPTSNVMYFNPNFSHKSSSQHITQHKDNTIRPKIYVNPNFIRPKAQDAPPIVSSLINTLPSMSTSTENLYIHTQPIQAVIENRNNSQLTVSKSRYCLVRQNEKVSIAPPLASHPIKIAQQTVKVNKYKLISLNSVKKSLISDQKLTSKLMQSTPTKINSFNILKAKYKVNPKPTLNVHSSRFRFIKKSSMLSSSPETTQLVRRVSLTHSKSVLKTSNRQHKKIAAGAMKKNNIPCPLFKKYGKCLRMLRGSCDYLHDKKHVSICRKFLKGICHDKHCLLSHDLTAKKMPTCYFYLQGNCTKESCPYLHVKLNEKTKICPDFLRGYCEKGDKCVHRHVNVSFDNNYTSNKIQKRSSYTNKHFPERKKINRKKSGKEDDTPSKVDSQNVIEIDFAKDQRYFKETKDDIITEEQYDLIKPTRCKLGTLPSFIQL